MRTKKQDTKVLQNLTEVEQDLLWQMQHGYQLETDSRRGGLRLRRAKDHAVIRPAAANRSTVKALEERGLINATKSRDPLTIIWRVNKN
jgi:hypothetical protein